MNGKSKLFIILGSWLLNGCFNIPPLDCVDDSVCGTKNPGVCVLTQGIGGACGVPDDTCPSGYRYYKDSSHKRGNECAVLATFELLPNKTDVTEHEVFSVHAVVKDGDGQRLGDYHGKPTLSSDWGDVRLFSASDFVNGEADFTIWLNRETNPNDGQLHLSLKDSSMSGRSTGITVRTSNWEQSEFVAPVEYPDNKPQYGFPSLFSYGQTFSLWSVLSFDGFDGSSVYRFSGTFRPGDFQAQGNGVLAANPARIPNFSVAFSGQDYRMALYATYPEGWVVSIRESSDGSNWMKQEPEEIDIIDGEATCITRQGDAARIARVLGVGGLTFEGGNKYRLFYSNLIKGGKFTSCTAISEDGARTWKSASLIEWPHESPHFFLAMAKDSNVYRAWVTGASASKTYHATSADGIHWVTGPAGQVYPYIRSVTWNDSQQRYFGIAYEKPTNRYQILTRR